MKYLSLLLILILIACQDNSTLPDIPADKFTHIKDKVAREIIRKSIQHAGGMDKWESMQRLAYTKEFSLLLESGAIEKEYKQIHDYHYNPVKIDIISRENKVSTRTIFSNNQYRRTIGKEVVEISQEELAKSVNTSLYVVGVPFKLLDEGAEVKYEGEDTLSDGRVVDIVAFSYNADKQQNHSSTEIWKYYFDKKEAKIVANWIKTNDHYSWVENLTYERVNGILFNKHRKSYRIDSLGNKLYLRAEYFYNNFVVE